MMRPPLFPGSRSASPWYNNYRSRPGLRCSTTKTPYFSALWQIKCCPVKVLHGTKKEVLWPGVLSSQPHRQTKALSDFFFEICDGFYCFCRWMVPEKELTSNLASPLP